MLNAIQIGIVTSSTKKRLEDLEQRKSEIELAIINEEIEHPFLTKEQIIYWINSFKDGNVSNPQFRERLIDTFVNSVYLYDDKVVITYNFKDGTKIITLSEVKNSDLIQVASPYQSIIVKMRLCFFRATISKSNNFIF